VSPPRGKRWVSAIQYPRVWRACAHRGWTSYSKARIRVINIVMFLHRILMLVAGAMFALSIFFVFRPHHPSTHQLATTACETSPETGAMSPEYSCEKP